jgi:hypothetical protein
LLYLQKGGDRPKERRKIKMRKNGKRAGYDMRELSKGRRK